MALKRNGATVNIGVVVATDRRVDESKNSRTAITCSELAQSTLNKHGHLLTGDVVSRREGCGRRSGGYARLSELIDRRLDSRRLTADIGESLIGTRTQRVASLGHEPGHVQSHLPAGNARRRLVGGRRDTSGDAVHGDAVHVG